MTRIKESSTHNENKKKLAEECIEIYATNLIGGQWTLAICCYLMNGKLRYSELKKCLPKITERMLTLQLRKLEENQIVKRTVFPVVPPRVEYELSEIGLQLSAVFDQLAKWGNKHKGLIER